MPPNNVFIVNITYGSKKAYDAVKNQADKNKKHIKYGKDDKI